MNHPTKFILDGVFTRKSIPSKHEMLKMLYKSGINPLHPGVAY